MDAVLFHRFRTQQHLRAAIRRAEGVRKANVDQFPTRRARESSRAHLSAGDVLHRPTRALGGGRLRVDFVALRQRGGPFSRTILRGQRPWADHFGSASGAGFQRREKKPAKAGNRCCRQNTATPNDDLFRQELALNLPRWLRLRWRPWRRRGGGVRADQTRRRRWRRGRDVQRLAGLAPTRGGGQRSSGRAGFSKIDVSLSGAFCAAKTPAASGPTGNLRGAISRVCTGRLGAGRLRRGGVGSGHAGGVRGVADAVPRRTSSRFLPLRAAVPNRGSLSGYSRRRPCARPPVRPGGRWSSSCGSRRISIPATRTHLPGGAAKSVSDPARGRTATGARKTCVFGESYSRGAFAAGTEERISSSTFFRSAANCSPVW